jgi:hypothetical protein
VELGHQPPANQALGEAEANPEQFGLSGVAMDSGFAAVRRPGMTWEDCAQHASLV